MAARDYYEVLGLSRDASAADIKGAYRKMAMKYHPDRNKAVDAEEHFKEAKSAYDILSDQQKRAAYDQFGHDGVNMGAHGDSGQGFGGNVHDIFGDIFDDLFGGAGRGGQGGHRGNDLACEIEISLEQAVAGTKETLRIPLNVRCDGCNATGAKPGSSPVQCTTCHGVGQVRVQKGFFSLQQACPSCRGKGELIKDPCSSCSGSGRVRRERSVVVKIPSGVEDGMRIRMAAIGEVGANGAPPGDLYVTVRVGGHPIFQRNGDNLYCEVPINFTTAALGGQVEVPTIDGKVRMKIASGTQSGHVLRLRGKGVPSLRGVGKGDLLCAVAVETPVKLSKRQKELLQQLHEEFVDTSKHSPIRSEWLDKVKRFIRDVREI
ncbi:MAG: molecular chaperone DnaJ [Candidatus Porifericomitaceae bacterium WSBS_2022_MAG_OTU9]